MLSQYLVRSRDVLRIKLKSQFDGVDYHRRREYVERERPEFKAWLRGRIDNKELVKLTTGLGDAAHICNFLAVSRKNTGLGPRGGCRIGLRRQTAGIARNRIGHAH